MTAPSETKVFFDTNVLVYTLASDDRRHARATEVIAAGGAISVQVLNEFIRIGSRKYHRPWAELIRASQAFRLWCQPILPITVATHDYALDIAQRYKFGIFDASILASALQAECTILYTEDMQDGQRVEGLTIRNPFAMQERR